MIHSIQAPNQSGSSIEAFLATGIYQEYTVYGVSRSPVQHLDAQTITGVDNGNTFSTWTARLGSNVTQATGTKRPTYQATGFNGLPCVRFDGTDDEQTSPDTSWTSTYGLGNNFIACVIFLVYKKLTITKGHPFSFGAVTGAPLGQLGFYDDNAVPQYAYDSNPYYVNTRANNTPYVASYQKYKGPINTTSISRLNGVVDNTAGAHSSNAPNISNGNFRIGSWGTTFGHVDIAEILVYNRRLTAAHVSTIETALATKWGI